MSATFSGQAAEARGPGGRGRVGRMEDAELLAPPEVESVQLSRNMFSQPAPRPPPAPLTNQHLKKVARLDGASGASASRSGSGSGAPPAGARPARSVAASSVRGGRAAFSVVSDEEVIEVDGEPTTLADDDLGLPPASPHDDSDGDGERGYPGGGGLGQSGIAGLGGGGGPDPLEELEADTPAVRLAEAQADLESELQGNKDPWVMVPLAQMVLAQAMVVWRTMPVAVREEPLLLAKAHFSLARAYQALGGCDRQASDHGKQALAAIPRDVAETEGARALRTEVQVMRAEALLSSAAVPGLPPDAACNQARKALALLVKAGGLTEPVAWTQEEVDENDLPGHVQRTTIDKVTDMGIVALMAQCHGVVAEARLRGAEAEEAEKRSSLRSAAEAAFRLDRKTERGDAFYSAEQMDKYRAQEDHFRDEADNHTAEALRLAAEAERAYDAAMYCLNAVIDLEGNRLEGEMGRDGKLAHPTFQALWRRSLDFMADIASAYAIQRKDAQRLSIIEEILTAFVQYGNGGWLPAARHIQALKDKGAMLVDKRDYEGAMSCYERLTELVSDLFAEDLVRKELQVAESLKLRGDVALAAGDFRTAQHMFNQALELYQRHLGAQAPVAADLLHRIDEVKSYLADTRVMGRLASFGGRASQTVAASVLAHSVSGSGAGSAVATPKSASIASRAGGAPRPPTLPLSGGPGSTRPSSGFATPLHPDIPGGFGTTRTSAHGGIGGASGRPSIDGGSGGGGSILNGLDGGQASPALSNASGPHRAPSGAGSLPALATGSRRPSLGSGTPIGRTSGGVRESAADAFTYGDGGYTASGGGEAPAAPGSVAGTHRSGDLGGLAAGWPSASPAASISQRSGGGAGEFSTSGGFGLDADVGAPGSPVLSHRSSDIGRTSGAGGWPGAPASHRSGDIAGSPSAKSLSHRSNTSGLGATGFGLGGSGGGDVSGGGWPGTASPQAAPALHHSGELNGSPSVTSLSRRSNASGFGAAGFGLGAAAAADVSGSAWPGAVAPASRHSGELGGSPSAASLSRRSNTSGFGASGSAGDAGGSGWHGAPASYHSGEIGGELGGSPSAASLSRRSNASGGLAAEASGADGGPPAPSVSASVASAVQRLGTGGLDNSAGSGGWPAAEASPSAASDTRRLSGANYGGGVGWGGSNASASRRPSGEGFGFGAGGAAAAASPAASAATSRLMSGDLLGGGADLARPASPSAGSTTSATRGYGGGYGGLGNSGNLFGGAAEEPARPDSPASEFKKSSSAFRSSRSGLGNSGEIGRDAADGAAGGDSQAKRDSYY